METASGEPTAPSTERVVGRPFPPGVSGNPNGRPKSKPLTTLLKAELQKPARGKSGLTKGQKLIERLLTIAMNGKRSESVTAMRLLFAYSDGLPTQVVEVDIYDEARRLAQQRGLDPDRVVSLLDAARGRRAAS